MSSESRYSTAFAHLVSGGSSVLGLIYLKDKAGRRSYWTYGTLAIFLVCSSVGVVRYGRPQMGSKLIALYGHSQFLSASVAYPLYVADLYRLYNYKEHFSYIHAASGLIPLIFYMYGNTDAANRSLDIVLGLNLVSAVVVSFLKENYYGIATAVTYGINHFAIGTSPSYLFELIPAIDLFHYGLSLLNFFIFKSLTY